MLENLNVSQMITVALNLIILYLFMKRFLFKPVTAFMENRSNAIKASMDAADQAKADAQELRRRYEEQLTAARSEAARMTNEARERASRDYEKATAAAKKDADDIIAKARETIDRERAEMLTKVRNQITGLALAAASKVIQSNMDTEKNRVLVDKFIEEEGVA